MAWTQAARDAAALVRRKRQASYPQKKRLSSGKSISFGEVRQQRNAIAAGILSGRRSRRGIHDKSPGLNFTAHRPLFARGEVIGKAGRKLDFGPAYEWGRPPKTRK